MTNAERSEHITPIRARYRPPRWAHRPTRISAVTRAVVAGLPATSDTTKSGSLLIRGPCIMPMRGHADQPAWGGPEAAGIKVKRRKRCEDHRLIQETAGQGSRAQFRHPQAEDHVPIDDLDELPHLSGSASYWSSVRRSELGSVVETGKVDMPDMLRGRLLVSRLTPVDAGPLS